MLLGRKVLLPQKFIKEWIMERELDSFTAVDEINRSATPIRQLTGVGPKISALLGKKGIYTVEDALYFLPRRYDDRRVITRIADAAGYGDCQTVMGKIVSISIVPYQGGRKKFFKMSVSDTTGVLTAKWFHFNYRSMMSRFKKNDHVILSGQIKFYGLQKEVHHPEIEVVELEDE